jgi:hypothetical protein
LRFSAEKAWETCDKTFSFPYNLPVNATGLVI